MAIKISTVLMGISLLFAIVTGNTGALSKACLDGCERAVEVSLSLLGMMVLWGGIMEVTKESGLLSKLSALLSPLLSPLFPSAFRSGKGKSEITAALLCNVLGIGNAATPLSLSAMKEMQIEGSDVATDDMVTFTVVSTACPCLLPTTVLALRNAAGSHAPFVILPAVWLTSFSLFLFGAILSRLLCGLRKRRMVR